MKRMPPQGLPVHDVLASLEDLRTDDVDWRNGRAFSLAYHAGPEAIGLAEEAYRRFSGENALSTDAFPSLKTMQADVVSMTRDWLGATADSAGFMTSGGTESILMIVKAARDQFRQSRTITKPNVVLPTSAHAAFEKACAYFDVAPRRSPVGADWRAHGDDMRALIDENTILLVASAPQYPQGVIDDVPSIAGLARDHDINCHVDACMGGVTLAYLERMGEPIPPWNLLVDGVTSMSVDLHKFGYTSKGASVVMYANKMLRSYQGFVTDNWLGGFYASSGALGTKSGGSIASAWSVMHHLGDDGYLELTRRARIATIALANHIEQHDDLVLQARPDASLLSFGARDPLELNIFAVADQLRTRGWYVDRQQPPDSLHCTINAIHHDKIDSFVGDLDEAIALAKANQRQGSVGQYGNLE